MVATVLRLRYRILGNTLARSPWQLVGFCFGALWGLSALALVGAGSVALAAVHDLTLTRTIVVVAGSVLLLGWVVGPLVVAGVDTTVDAAKLATFPLTTRQLMAVLTATGLTGIPGIATSLAALLSILMWMPWPPAAIVAVPCVLVAVLTCVVATRLAATLSTGLGAGRRGRELIGTIVLAVVIFAGPILSGAVALVSGGRDLVAQLQQVAGILAWTPLGAAWAVPGDVAAGEWLLALARLLIALATLGALWVAWRAALERSTDAPPRRAARTVRQGALGLFGVMPTGGVGATWARSLRGWLRDPRYVRQLILVPLFPILFAFTGGIDGFLFPASALLVAFVLCIAGYSDISYDGTAFASVLASGVRGRQDRLGRVLGAATVGVPLVIVVAVVTAIVSGRAAQLPGILGASLGLLLAGHAVSSVSSALLVTPVAAPGDSPFKTVPGQTFLSGLMVFVVMGACGLLALPALVLGITAMSTASATLGAVALLVGLVVGIAEIAAGIVVGGRTLDRTGPDLLLRIKAFPTT
ncbi:MAG: hypothetical protein J0I43_12925 [Microbacterium sp.]|uniref:hypothetical protein n=1 Tax=Microbacterium sp. TaxID=51671 RepID=UPI001AC54C60|nr:hypothetical protein [Microbacterium sp.]MBN9178252.1 hypothetical protein [Microbacterium sp.]